MRAAASAVRRAPAKVNLALAITGRRADGYHELRSVFLRVGLSDRLEGRLDAGSTRDQLSVAGDEDCPVDGNSVLRALRLFREAAPANGPLAALRVRLEKRIPIAAGLGGGSSDGAAALELAAAIWAAPGMAATARAIAAQVGADVPFFSAGLGQALVSGIGEGLEPLEPVAGEPGILLVTPAARLSTRDVFAAFDQLGTPGRSDAAVGALGAAFRGGLDAQALAAWGVRLRDANDLWPAAAALQPGLVNLRSTLERALARPFLLSGSGSTLFALYPWLDEAREAGRSLVSQGGLDGATIFAVGLDIHHDAWRFA